MQLLTPSVPTEFGWVFVNPYMTLVAAYERQIGGRGSEILPGQPAPPIPDKPPVILHLEPAPQASVATPQPAAKPEISVTEHAKPQRHRQVHKKRRQRHKDG